MTASCAFYNQPKNRVFTFSSISKNSFETKKFSLHNKIMCFIYNGALKTYMQEKQSCYSF